MIANFIEPNLTKSIEDASIDKYGEVSMGIALNDVEKIQLPSICGCGCCGELPKE
jgi:hypothetical protein